MNPEGLVMLALLISALSFVNLAMLLRLWRDGRARRKALRAQLDMLSPPVPGRAGRRRD
jgi:hypothetical protein